MSVADDYAVILIIVGAFISIGAWRIYAKISKKTSLLSNQVQPTYLLGENSSRCKCTKDFSFSFCALFTNAVSYCFTYQGQFQVIFPTAQMPI